MPAHQPSGISVSPSEFLSFSFVPVPVSWKQHTLCFLKPLQALWSKLIHPDGMGHRVCVGQMLFRLLLPAMAMRSLPHRSSAHTATVAASRNTLWRRQGEQCSARPLDLSSSWPSCKVSLKPREGKFITAAIHVLGQQGSLRLHPQRTFKMSMQLYTATR